jgi:DNA mismatch endonuclease (patch repair protein)
VSNRDYWVAKIARNAARDEKHLSALESSGWRSFVLWECELRDPSLESRLQRFLQG